MSEMWTVKFRLGPIHRGFSKGSPQVFGRENAMAEKSDGTPGQFFLGPTTSAKFEMV